MTRRQATVVGTLAAVTLALGSRLLRRRRAISLIDKTVVIFGGSRGLGLVLAREFALRGARIVLLARDADELERARLDLDARGMPAIAIACDVRDRAQVDAAIDQVVKVHGTIDVLVNDAGIIEVGPLDHMNLADFEDAMATHFWGPLHTILSALPHMRRAGARRIVNISSIGGKIAVPHLLPYCASKFALTGLSEGLHVELAREGFAVTTVCPGLMRTGSTYNARFKGQHRREFGWFHVASAVPGVSISAIKAARRIIEACRHGDAELVITPSAQLAVWLNAVSPATMARAMSIGNRLLPAAADDDGNRSRSGWQSTSALVPSALTALSDEATAANNET